MQQNRLCDLFPGTELLATAVALYRYVATVAIQYRLSWYSLLQSAK